VRYTVDGNVATGPSVILDNLGYGPSFGEDNGGALAFGSDGKLYASVGVLENDAEAQNPSSLSGKVLRINDDGSVPVDNPTPGSLVWASGFRDAAGLAVHAGAGTVYAPDGYDADDTCDEVNVVTAGANYGWDVESCGGGTHSAPLQTLEPQIGAAGAAVTSASAYPTAVCASAPLQDCSFEQYCSNDPTRPCTHTKVCSHDDTIGCRTTLVCSNDHRVECTSSADCGGNPCIEACGAGNTCVDYCGAGEVCEPVCGGDPCVDSTHDTLYVAGHGAGVLFRDLLTGASADTLDTSAAFYRSERGALCPQAIAGVAQGNDGWLYVVADDPDPVEAGVYRILYDAYGGVDAAPREVSASQHVPLTLAKSGAGIGFYWEDLKREAWGCSPGHCPAGSDSELYTLWNGTLGSFGSHTVLVETTATDHNDALVTHTEADMPGPGQDLYFLVSARSSNREGTTGFDSNGIERAGHATADLCDAIGYGSPNTDLDRCTGEIDITDDGSGTCSFVGNSYPDQYGRLWTMEDFRGKAVVLSFAQFG
jgi:hypothetical protein